MTEHNHHRGTKRRAYKVFKVHHGTRPNAYYEAMYPDRLDIRNAPHEDGGYDYSRLSNGSPPPDDKPWGYVRGAKKGFADQGKLSGVRVSAGTEWESSKGRRGMSKQVRGAKKFVRSRIRFHENNAVRQLVNELLDFSE